MPLLARALGATVLGGLATTAYAVSETRRFVLRRGNAAWRVDVAWLTGEVTLERGEGRP